MVYLATDIWNSPSLEHHGVKGMKWGVRHEPARNQDGRRPKNRLQVQNQTKPLSKRQQMLNAAFTPGKKGKPSPAEKITRSSTEAISSSKDLVRKTQRKKSYSVSRMSDSELRAAVNRLELERRYESLKNEDISRGRRKISYILDIMGSLLAISSSAAAIGTAVYQIKNSQQGG